MNLKSDAPVNMEKFAELGKRARGLLTAGQKELFDLTSQRAVAEARVTAATLEMQLLAVFRDHV